MKKNKILIIEDDRVLVEALKFELGELGYDIAVSLDGDGAYEKVLKERPDVILLDLVYRNIELFKHPYGNPMQEVTLSQKNLPQLKDLNKFLDLHRLAWI